jgi:hypothetical protein
MIPLNKLCEREHNRKRGAFCSTFSTSRAVLLFTVDRSASSIAIVEQTSPSSSEPVKYLSKKALFKARNNRKVPVLLERDIEEAFIRGVCHRRRILLPHTR